MTSDSLQENGEIPAISILGVKISRVDMASALSHIRSFIRSGQPHIVVTADSSGVVMSQTDVAYRDIVNNADLVTPDSAGILLGAKMLGTPLITRVSGIDVAKEMCRAAAQDGFSVYLFGAKPGVAQLAGEKLCEMFPGLQIAGVRDGYFSDEDVPEIVREIKASGAKALFVALGIPRQEKWICDHIADTGVCVAMGVGGSFDVLSGNIKRAPVWMQKHGLEWAYRLAKDPSKITKVSFLPRFLLMVMRSKRRIGK